MTRTTNAFQFTSTLERSTNRLWGCHFRVPYRVAQKLGEGDSRRVVCLLNDSAEYQCAMLPFGDGVFVITVNKKLRDSLDLEFGMEVRVRLTKDKSEYGLPMPEELFALLQQDPEGKALFRGLTPGKQRTLLYIIGSVKNPEKRVTRALAVVNHLKANNGRINYKELNVAVNDPFR